MSLADLTSLVARASAVHREAAQGDRLVVVEGQVGSGRTTLVDELRRIEPNLIFVAAPDLTEDCDAVAHVLLQVAAQAGAVSNVIAGDPDSKTRGLALRAELARIDRLLVVWLPRSWAQTSFENADSEHFADRGSDLIDGLLKGQKQETKVPRSIVLAAEAGTPSVLRAFGKHVKLPAVLAGRHALKDRDVWGEYSEHAAKLAKKLGDEVVRFAPLHLRLAVGVIASGYSADALGSDLIALRETSTRKIFEELLKRLGKRLSDENRKSLRKIALARFPLSTDAALGLAGLPSTDEPLLSRCLGYEAQGLLRLTDPVRKWLLEEASKEGDDSAHVELANHYQTLDGKADPRNVDANAMTAWLEKVHHLANAGRNAGSRWEQNELPLQELFWDRGRSLSKVHKDYEAAASVFEACTQRFPADHYAWHYFAFNLQRLKSRPIEAEAAFRKAIELDPANHWWNARLVTSLIERGQIDGADLEWNRALDRLDPDRTSTDEHLAKSVHRWVIAAWLEMGEVARARDVFESLPKPIRTDDVFTALKLRLEDAEEALALTDSVYPPNTPTSHRWRTPTFLGERNANGQRLESWYPGRVVEATAAHVELVFATVEKEIEQRRLIRLTLSPREWSDYGGWCDVADAKGYVFLARYEGGEGKIVPQPAE